LKSAVAGFEIGSGWFCPQRFNLHFRSLYVHVGSVLTNYEKTSRANDSELAQNSKSGRMAMMRLIVEEVGKGLHPSEAVVAVKTADGVQRLVVSSRSIQKGTISVGWPLGEREDAILVELPRETQSGAWRVWVPKNQLIEEERMRA
jgi:hypothetical protein